MSDTTTILLPEWVATVKPGDGLLHNHAVVVQGSTIKAIAPSADALAQFPGAEQRVLKQHLLTPGFVNIHTHAAMSLLRGFADDLPLQEWLQTRIWPAEGKAMSPEFVYDGSVLACFELLTGGTTSINDMYFFPEQTGRAAQALSMRATVGIMVIDFPSAYGSGPDEYLRKGIALRDALADDPLINFTLAPHAPYTVSDDVFERIAMLAAELQLPVHLHIHETQVEVDEALKQHRERPIARLNRLGLVNPQLISVHSVHLNEEEIALFARNGVSVAHCPHSNQKLGSGIAPIAKLLQGGVNVAIGTDGSASNNRLDMLQETRAASLLAKGAARDAAIFNATQALHAMTLAGARALGQDDQIGSIEVGKQADLVAIDLSAPELQPVYDPISQLIYAADKRHISDVWVAGKHVVHKQRLVDPNGQAVVSEVVARIPVWQNCFSDVVHDNAAH